MPRAIEEGRLRYHPKWASKQLSTRHDIIVYVPPGYDESQDKYPVLYLHDGQNMFDPSTAFNWQDWRADVTADGKIRAGEISPLIMVGVYHAGVRRISEYTPTRDPKMRKGGKADRHATMLARELKPFIDSQYRTLRDAANTGIGGSSLGALAALVAGVMFPRVFGNVAVMSPSVWWDQRSILALVRSHRMRVRPRVWLDCGTQEGGNPTQVVADTLLLRDELVAKGWVEGEDLRYCECESAGHSEGAWADRFGAVLEFFFGVKLYQM